MSQVMTVKIQQGNTMTKDTAFLIDLNILLPSPTMRLTISKLLPHSFHT
jgi:hypothetical protein